MTHEIRNPNPPLYFIAWDLEGEVKHPITYGLVNSDQWVITGLDFIQTFENEQDYLDALLAEGIVPENF